MAEDTVMKLLVATLGMGWLSTGVGWWRDRTTRRQEILKFLIEKRQKLDHDPELLAIVGFLRMERQAKEQRLPPPAQPPGLDGRTLRKLPAFLEPIGPYLAYNIGVPRSAYEVFGEEVLLCHRSDLLWADEGPDRYSDTWWLAFKKLARETERRLGEARTT